MINWWSTKLGEEEAEAAKCAVESRGLSEGPIVKRVEESISAAVGAKHCVMTPSGSTALVLALLSVGVRAGDKVIVPSATWVATANAVTLIGAKAVLVDVCEEEPLLDINSLAAFDPTEIKAIIVAHLNGLVGPVNDLKKSNIWKDVPIVEDACQAFLSKDHMGRPLGTLADVGCYSFGVTKLITCGQGGAVVTNNTSIYNDITLFKNNGVCSVDDPVYLNTGLNFKISDVLASILEIQLGKVQDHIDRVRYIYEFYKANIDNEFLKLIPGSNYENTVPLYTQALIKDRDVFIEYMGKQKINIRRYPPSLHYSNFYNKLGEYENSTNFGNNGLYLPCGPFQEESDLATVCDSLNSWRI